MLAMPPSLSLTGFIQEIEASTKGLTETHWKFVTGGFISMLDKHSLVNNFK